MPPSVYGSVRDFPVDGLLPKEETQSASFIRAHPEYDGRGVVIAILDTGVDPGAPGLQWWVEVVGGSGGWEWWVEVVGGSGGWEWWLVICPRVGTGAKRWTFPRREAVELPSPREWGWLGEVGLGWVGFLADWESVTTDGKPKVINIIDCTGQVSGDVPCTTVLEATEEGGKRLITGLSGRKLVLGDWKNPTGKYRLGVKNSNDLFPKGLWDRLAKEEKKKFEVEHHALVTKVQNEAAQFDAANPSPNEEQQQMKNEHKARLEVLKDQWKSYENPGRLIDCVVFHDGEKWRAAIDVNESGDLTKAKLLTNFADELEYSRFGNDSMLNFSVNIYDEGETLSIVTLAGSHGTHVAAISAAHYPDDSRLNGVAPGAQIVSLKIGDTRLGSMETGSGLVRAAIELARLKIDTANISYGEAAGVPDYGRFIELLRDEVVNKAGCVVLSSAGNAGPALTTVGAPGGTTSGVIGVGAYVTRGMMESEYALLESVEERPYTWTSRGPTADGDVGVDIFAPGAAITSVPQYTIQNAQLMNGTSMSSPNCCGCVALLLSGLKAEGIPYNPYRIKAAIVNTGKDIQDQHRVPFIQVEKAWDHLLAERGKLGNYDVHYDITLPEKSKARGIYLRDLDETNDVQTIQVNVQPKFPKADEPSQNAVKLVMEAKVALVPTERWISAPEFVHLNNGGRGFTLRIDPRSLQPGFHFGQVIGYDTNNKALGPLFQVPVTVCKPQPVDLNANESLYRWEGIRFEPGTIERRFIGVPAGANFAEITVRSQNRDTPARFIVHLMQLQPVMFSRLRNELGTSVNSLTDCPLQQTRYPKFEHEYAFSLASSGGSSSSEESTYTKLFPVLSNVALEVCLAQFWSSLGKTNVSIELKFHGILAAVSVATSGGLGSSSGSGGDLVYLNSGNHGFSRVDLCAPVRKEVVSPSVSFDTLRRFIRPTESQISPLKSRDVLPDSRQLHQLVLTYSVKLTDAGSGTNVTPRFPKFNDVLYDAAVESFALIVFDSNKRSLSYQVGKALDIYPKAVKLSDGTYTIRVQIQSASVETLDKYTSTVLTLDVSLSKSLSLTTYSRLGHAVTGTTEGDAAFKKKVLQRGERTVFWVGSELSGGLPKDAKQGDLLVGKMEVQGGEKKADGTLYSVAWIVPPEAKANEEGGGSGEKEPPKEDAVLLKEATRDLQIGWLKKMKKEESREALMKQLEGEYPDHLPYWMAKLDVLSEAVDKAEKSSGGGGSPSDLLKQVVGVSERILEIVDERELAVYFGTKHDTANGGEKEKNLKKENERRKEAVVSAYQAKGRAVKELIVGLEKKDREGKTDDATKDAPTTKSPYPSIYTPTLPTDIPILLTTLDTTLTSLSKWVDSSPPTGDGKYLLLWSWRQRRKGLYATALKGVNKWAEDKKNAGDGEVYRKVLGERRELLRGLGWGVWEGLEERWGAVRVREGWAPF
ncbi:tripeptidyl-peptidase II Tpp2 [Rhizophlyctis rosea]|nr:tripeptidyl-peptidase II Tpp2 [Rhizophlyctis rosea]